MTTDPKDAEIARYDLDLMESRMVKDQWGGEWVRHSDHAAEIARLTARAERDQARVDVQAAVALPMVLKVSLPPWPSTQALSSSVCP